MDLDILLDDSSNCFKVCRMNQIDLKNKVNDTYMCTASMPLSLRLVSVLNKPKKTLNTARYIIS